MRRRALLGGALGAGVAWASAGCTTATNRTSAGRPGQPVKLPSYLPYQGLKPDAPGLDNGTAPYFATYPKDPPKFSTRPPGDGGEISTLTIMNNVPKPVGENRWWQAVNELLGVQVNLAGVPVGDFVAKSATLVASGDLPDLVTVLPAATHDLPGLLKAKFADLTPHLSGDAVHAYPGLANIPTYAWRNGVHNGGIYLIPIPRFALFRCFILRADLVERTGLSSAPESGEELLELMRALTVPSRRQWATGEIRGVRDLACQMTGAPQFWREEGGTFTSTYLTDEYRRGLDITAQAWKEGLIHPDAFGANMITQVATHFFNGTSPFLPATAGWASVAVGAVRHDPAAKVTAFPVPQWEGGGYARNWLTAGSPYWVGLKAADPARIEMLLSVINVLAAPWGTEEYILIKNGIKDWDYTVADDGTYQTTENGEVENIYPIQYNGAPALVHNAPLPAYGRGEYESENHGMSHPYPDPTAGLQSATRSAKGAQLDSQIWAAESDVIQGRKSLQDWDKAVAEWRAAGGDKIKAELEEAFQAGPR